MPALSTLFLHSFKVFGGEQEKKNGTRIGWMQERPKANGGAGALYCKMACAKEDGLNQYHLPRQRFEAAEKEP
jgi:hypothetical protein